MAMLARVAILTRELVFAGASEVEVEVEVEAEAAQEWPSEDGRLQVAVKQSEVGLVEEELPVSML
ncbi:hypothetical protein PspLS_10027 [Pyricularia sp. CBS 133598]|nr:hypothetical protein PspLS_10027 [Pyricularia sp. CBS 133598]